VEPNIATVGTRTRYFLKMKSGLLIIASAVDKTGGQNHTHWLAVKHAYLIEIGIDRDTLALHNL
jgi:hypothetical protein